MHYIKRGERLREVEGERVDRVDRGDRGDKGDQLTYDKKIAKVV